MSRYDGCDGGSSFFAFILGAIIGAGAMALLSPTSGPENRRRLSELKDDISERTEGLRNDAMDRYESAREKLDDAVDKGKDFIQKQKGILSSAIEAGKEAYDKERHSSDDKS